MKYVNYEMYKNRHLIHIPYDDWREARRVNKLNLNNTLCIGRNTITVEHFYGDSPKKFKEITVEDVIRLSDALKHHQFSKTRTQNFVKDFILWWINKK